MKKEKGFTLIELLAVIVILAILMVIAVPKILNVINNSKKSAADSSIKLLKDAIKTQITSKDMMNSNFISDENGCYVFEFSPNNDNANTLNVKNKDKFTGSIKYCKGTFSDDTLKFNDVASNNTSSGSIDVDPEPPQEITKICKRATTLHTEECTQTDTKNYCSGAGYTTSGTKGTSTITYGNLGTSGTLSSGDAFDCDVNGDGNYDPNTERFYYVTDLSTTAAVLVYYNSVSSGSANNNASYAYDSAGTNYNGPVTAVTALPTTEQWNNIKLVKGKRRIKTENNKTSSSGGKLPSFDYAGYAARLLTVQEINKSCNITIGSLTQGELDDCNYLLENTKFSSASVNNYGYWLENAYEGSSSYIENIMVDSRSGRNNSSSRSNGMGVRPVIEVLKTDIDY